MKIFNTKVYPVHWFTVQGTLFLIFVSLLFSEEPKFSFATPDRKLVFPQDHGSHPDFKIEWWYITGHLFDRSDHRYGFESTFFRLAQKPGQPTTDSSFDDSQIYMAHMAITDINENKFYHEERLNREGWNAYSKIGDLDLRNGNWTLHRDQENRIHLSGSIQSRASFSLTLSPQKEHVMFGENGVSQKGKSPGSASHYITWTRLAADGEMRLGKENLKVTGSAWMDHEISSSQLDDDQTGWDWVSVQLDDGREIMAYMLRLKNGGYSKFSKLVWIDQDGTLTHQSLPKISWEPGGHWESPTTGASYPISPKFTTIDPKTGKNRTFHVIPLMKNQEMTGKLGGVPYWEGACDVTDGSGKIVGRAYLELAGYVDGLNEKLR